MPTYTLLPRDGQPGGEQLAENKHAVPGQSTEGGVGTEGNADVAQIEAKVASEDFNLTRQQNLYADAMLKLKGKRCSTRSTRFRSIPHSAGNGASRTARSADSIYRTATDFLPKARIAQLDFKPAMLNFRTAKMAIAAFSLSLSGVSTTSYSQTIGETPVDTLLSRQQFKDRVGKYVKCRT